MKIAIASGKGGTGKTTVATNLAIVVSESGNSVHLMDCDVEEPNCHIFVKPKIERKQAVTVPVPLIDEAKCTGCGQCVAICEYNAIVCIKKKVLIFPQLCHGCSGCWLVCPEKAISQGAREVGVVEHGPANGFLFTQGRLRIGEVMSPRLIKGVKTFADDSEVTIIDCPPGTSCPVIEAVKGADYVILVTEPTPFGLNDLGLALDVVRELGLKYGVIVNRYQEENTSARDFCKERDVSIIAEIPDDRRVAEAYSRGAPVLIAIPRYREYFQALWEEIQAAITNSAQGKK